MSGAPAVGHLYLFGAGGHGRELGWIAREVLPTATLEYVVDDELYVRGPVNGIPVSVLADLRPRADAGFVAAVGDVTLRRRAVSALLALGLSPVPLVHPRAERTSTVTIDDGAVVFAGVVLTDNIRIGQHAVVNAGCTLSHDISLAPFATLSPGVHVAGHVIIEDGAFLGVGASVRNGSADRPLVIGENAVVAAGATVIQDVASGTVVGGVPARLLRGKAPA